ncbi:hypothetical protein C6P40_001084 [Pichia californica]|uniref:Zn(2)-C6 fungal-type domain-containing protein n=1 Tax=Pichia californica TaxID=460514 RepID=A0A9P6WPJ6_9ASCO|nr:hypothetical protein C6P40_001084 [[Candida] californica]
MSKDFIVKGCASKQRIKLACDRCREKKRKCDGGKPICEACLNHDIHECKYSYGTDKRRPYKKTYVDSLLKHIKYLETKLENNEQLMKTVGIPNSGLSYDKLNTAENILQSHTENKTFDLELDTDFINNNAKIDINDFIDSYGKFKITNGDYYRYYGPRSTISFISNNFFSINTIQVDNNTNNNNVIIQDLGIDMSTEHYLYDLYFAYQNSTLIFIWKELFYQQLNLPIYERDSNIISECLQYSIMAVGSIFDHKNTNKLQQGINYAKRARKLLTDEMSKPHISTVQTCGILSLFYIFMNDDALAWHFHGCAISTAYSLGLNIGDNAANSIFFSEEEMELRRITFWAIYVLERALNNILGRPTFLKSESIINMVPSEIGISEYEIWKNPHNDNSNSNNNNNDNNNNSGKISTKIYTRCFSVMTYTIELLIITSKPLDHLYLSFKPSNPSELQFIINKANVELLQFESTLPEYLRISSITSFKNRGLSSPGLFIFQLKFQHTLILLHRVFFIRSFKTLEDANEKKILPHKKICYDSAINICRLISLYEKGFDFKNFEFNTPDIICAAAIIFLYFIKNPKLLENDASENKVEVYNQATVKTTAIKSFKNMEYSLQKISETNYWAKRCLFALQQIVSDQDIAIWLL